jgi:hypothetical protein
MKLDSSSKQRLKDPWVNQNTNNRIFQAMPVKM